MKIVKWVRHPEGTAEIPPPTLPLTISSALARAARSFWRGFGNGTCSQRPSHEPKRSQNPRRRRRPTLSQMATVFIDPPWKALGSGELFFRQGRFSKLRFDPGHCVLNGQTVFFAKFVLRRSVFNELIRPANADNRGRDAFLTE